MIERRRTVTFPGVARRAGVSVSLLYGDPGLASRLAEARGRQQVTPEPPDTRPGGCPARSLVTEQSLHADLANAKDQLPSPHRGADRCCVTAWRASSEPGPTRRNGRGASPCSVSSREDSPISKPTTSNYASARHRSLKETLRESNETLAAARAMNRELMTEINRPGQREDVPPARYEVPAAEEPPVPVPCVTYVQHTRPRR